MIRSGFYASAASSCDHQVAAPVELTQPDLRALPRAALLVGSEVVVETSGGYYQHVYPATDTATASIPLAGSAEIDYTVHTARLAFATWRLVPADDRRRVLLRFATQIRDHAPELTELATIENGMIRATAQTGPQMLADSLEYNAGWADKNHGEVIPTWPARALDYTIEEPYGVVGIIVSWNNPIATAGMTLAPALAAGNCVVFKAPEIAPWTSLRIGELALAAGLPPGVLNVVPAGPVGSEAMVRHPGVDFVHFTGSTRTAQHVLRAAADTVKPVGLELGGKSARLVFADADVSAAIDQTASQIGKLAGQGCLNGMRVLFERSIYDDALHELAARASQLDMGDPYSPATEIGPVVNTAALSRISAMIDRAETGGARLVSGGRRAGGRLAAGCFLQPTVFAEVDPSSELDREEIFGPVITVGAFASESEAIERANDSVYGLASYIWTRDLHRAHRMADQIQVGNVWINGFGGLHPSLPFGGHKHSGYGRLGGRHAIREFTHTKNVWTPLSAPSH